MMMNDDMELIYGDVGKLKDTFRKAYGAKHEAVQNMLTRAADSVTLLENYVEELQWRPEEVGASSLEQQDLW